GVRGAGADAAAETTRVRLELAPALLLALGAIEDEEVLAQARLVVVERLDLDCAAGATAGGLEPMTVCIRPRANVLDRWPLCELGPADDERHHSAAIEQQQPPDRTPEEQIALAVLQVGVPDRE